VVRRLIHKTTHTSLFQNLTLLTVNDTYTTLHYTIGMVENKDKAAWCDLHATVEDIFLQAAFLVVPHIHYTYSSEIVRGKNVNKKHRYESAMGNIAFELHAAELLKMSPQQQRECVKERFRAAFILTTPYTLYLKSKKVYTVDDLLRVNISDLSLPQPLVIQLEVLLTAVVAKCVDARIVPIPRDHLSTAADMFTVPMYYDPKFQRSPFDPFGRPPRLQPKGKDRIVQKKLKQSDIKNGAVNKAESNLSVVASVNSIQNDLEVPVTLWTTHTNTSNGGVTNSGSNVHTDDEHNTLHNSLNTNNTHSAHNNINTTSTTSQYSLGTNLLDDSVVDGKWSFNAHNDTTVDFTGVVNVEDGASSGVLQSPKGVHSPTHKHTTHAHNAAHSTHTAHNTHNNTHTNNTTTTTTKPSKEEHNQSIIAQASVVVPTDNNTWKKSLRKENKESGKNPYAAPRVLGSSLGLSQSADFMTRTIEDKVFKHSFVCTHPHCGQVFARQYTYNIHLKSHELFGQYHDYKRQPQLYLDKDRGQIGSTAQKQYNDRISLPPMVQTELMKSISR